MKRAFALACLLGLLAVPAAAAGQGPAQVKVKSVKLAAPVHGRGALLVTVRYPIAMVGHRVRLAVSILQPGQSPLRSWALQPLASVGPVLLPEHRRRFDFVHRIDLSAALTRRLEGGRLRVRARAVSSLDANRDGVPELASTDVATQIPHHGSIRDRVCSTIPQLRAKPGRRIAVRVPVCDSKRTRWDIVGRPRHGTARVRDGVLTYRPGKHFRGTDSFPLVGMSAVGTPPARSARPAAAFVTVRVGSAQSTVVRAIGDSVTAGFGYYDDGRLMGLTSLPECKPGSVTLVDACSSNSTTLDNSAKKLEFAPDYGLANNVSWAAQWANEHGVTNYENLAVSGSEPVNWAPGGSLYEITKRVESEDPDYLLMTLGANPLLSEMLFGVENMGCAIYADLFGRYEECIEESFAEVKLREYLKNVYADLVAKTDATIYLMQYHLSIPSTALAYTAFQIAEMGKLLNREIASVAKEVNPQRLRVVAPPHFNVGIDISPVYPSKFSCSRLGFRVDGPSVQIDLTQDELLAAHPLSFCEGPVSGPPWVISGDTGIHPSATGYTQMASQVPAPEGP